MKCNVKTCHREAHDGFKQCDRCRETNLKWNRTRAMDPVFRQERRVLHRKYNVAIKEEVLAHYGIDGVAQCSWPGCLICDIDMLSLDHIDNGGAKHRKVTGHLGGKMYRWAKTNDYPEIFQTLCMNHQLKKEILRRRAACQAPLV